MASSFSGPVTEGELQFERYLNYNRLKWQKDQPFGLKKPDYLVQSLNGEVLCEIKDFGEGDLDKAALKGGLLSMRDFFAEQGDSEDVKRINSQLQRLQKAEPAVAAAWDPFKRLQEKVKTAAEQLKPAKGKLPCVLVLFNPGFMPNDRDLIIRIGLGKNRLFTKNENTSVGALAVLELSDSNAEWLEALLRSKISQLDAQFGQSGARSQAELVAAVEQLAEFEEVIRKRYPAGYFDESVPTLRIYHNKFAELALPQGSFPGMSQEEVTTENLWPKSASSEIGRSIVFQDRDWTCNHCGAFRGVTVTADDETSQQWTCSTCKGCMNIEKLEEGRQRIRLGAHGPNRASGDGTGRCCLPA